MFTNTFFTSSNNNLTESSGGCINNWCRFSRNGSCFSWNVILEVLFFNTPSCFQTIIGFWPYTPCLVIMLDERELYFFQQAMKMTANVANSYINVIFNGLLLSEWKMIKKVVMVSSCTKRRFNSGQPVHNAPILRTITETIKFLLSITSISEFLLKKWRRCIILDTVM